jgi:hypothetical protein
MRLTDMVQKDSDCSKPRADICQAAGLPEQAAGQMVFPSSAGLPYPYPPHLEVEDEAAVELVEAEVILIIGRIVDVGVCMQQNTHTQ